MNVFTSTIIPLLADLFTKIQLSGAEKILLGTMIYCVSSLLECLYYLAEIKSRTQKEDKLWDIRDAVDDRLAGMRRSFRLLEASPGAQLDLFFCYFRDRLEDLERELKHTANSGTLRVDSQQLDLTDSLLGCFAGKEQDVLRVVHFFANNEAWLDVHEAQWFFRVLEGVKSRRIVQVQRLLVYDNPQEIESDESQRIIRFHEHTKDYSCKLIRRHDFDRITRDYRLKGEFIDFAVYSDRYLYRTLSFEGQDFIGAYSKDVDTVVRYIEFFDFCWASLTAREVGVEGLAPISVEELFSLEI